MIRYIINIIKRFYGELDIMKHEEITQEEFDNNSDIKSAEEILNILKEKYISEYFETIDGLIGYCQDMDMIEGYKSREYSLEDIHSIFNEDQIIDYIDDCIEEEIIINYFTTDSIGTNRGVWKMIIDNSYIGEKNKDKRNT